LGEQFLVTLNKCREIKRSLVSGICMCMCEACDRPVVSCADVEVLLLFVERKGRNGNKEKGIKREEEKA
jgi:hypothetical protein